MMKWTLPSGGSGLQCGQPGPSGPGRVPGWVPRDLLEPLALLAVDPGLGGAILQDEAAGGARELALALRRTLEALEGRPLPFVEGGPPFSMEAFAGHLDWSASLRAGRRIQAPGLWDRARGGLLFIHRGQDLDPAEQALLAQRLDAVAGDAGANPLVLVHLSTPASPSAQASASPAALETPSVLTALETRLALRLEVPRIPSPGRRLERLQELLSAPHGEDAAACTWLLWDPEDLARARRNLPGVAVHRRDLERLCQLAWQLGVANPALEALALRAAKARAALHGRRHLVESDGERAIQWVLKPRRTSGGAPDRTDHNAIDKTGGIQAGSVAVTGGAAHKAKVGPPHGAKAEAPGAARPSSLAPTSPAGGPGPGSRPAGAARGEGPSGSGDAPLTSPGAAPMPPPGLLQLVTAAQEMRLQELSRWLAPLSSAAQRQAGGPKAAGCAFPAEPAVSRRSHPARPARLQQTGFRGSSGGNVATPGPWPTPDPPAAARLALAATLAAALPWQPFREPAEGMAIALQPEDLRWHPPRPQGGTLYVMVVDTSGSMGRTRVRTAQSLALGLLRKAYLQRDHVALLRCSGLKPALLLPPSRSSSAARRALESLPVGGGTPLPEALALATDLVRAYRRRHPQREAVVALLTDGRANVAWRPGARPGDGNVPERTVPEPGAIETQLAALGRALQEAGATVAVVDRDRPGLPAEDARHLAALLGAAFIPL